MCLIAEKVETVSATKIYVSPNKDGTRQLTIYSNSVNTNTPNAMVLPVPTSDVSSINFVDLSNYPDFFNDCEHCFAKALNRGNVQSFGVGRMTGTRGTTLQVHSVGSYKASIVPTLEDFDRLDGTVFKITDEFSGMLKENYPSNFCFIVCQLNKGSHTYHPFAYTHPITQSKQLFKSPHKQLFIPTKHWHAHGVDNMKGVRVYDENNIHNSPMFAEMFSNDRYAQRRDILRSGNDGADWDHTIYSPNTHLDSTNENKYRFVNTSPIKWDKLPNEYRWASNSTMKRWKKQGDWRNVDITVEVPQISNRPVVAVVAVVAETPAPAAAMPRHVLYNAMGIAVDPSSAEGIRLKYNQMMFRT